ncbi:uncharacterized protein V1510DRAFT_418014 [Dipodascopsis tothii]|uniref:uncharacterized protein n=1 Tax=Dipodascopsis tothii TaxID=44089 RepID=UPI0034CD1425
MRRLLKPFQFLQALRDPTGGLRSRLFSSLRKRPLLPALLALTRPGRPGPQTQQRASSGVYAAKVDTPKTVSPHHQVSFDNRKVYVPWEKGVTSSFHNIWLRDSCQCERCFHPVTKQRLLDTFAIPEHIRPETVEAQAEGLHVVWANDGHTSLYSWAWLHQHSYLPVLEKPAVVRRTYWGEEIADEPPTVEYDAVMAGDAAVGDWTSKISEFGFCFVSGVPVTPEATQALVERIAFVRPTHYGGFWDFTSDMAKNDTAYSEDALRPHTDGTYFTDPPGLQLLHLLHHEGSGGASVLVDGFRAARELRERDRDAYKTLSRVRIPAHSAGNDDVFVRPAAMPRPVLSHDDTTGELIQVRWNNDDRSTMSRWGGRDPDVAIHQFYDAIRRWNGLLTRSDAQYWFRLQPGKAVIFNNWRLLHGRSNFTGSRRLCGAYINMDDFVSRMLLTNFGRDRLLEQI